MIFSNNTSLLLASIKNIKLYLHIKTWMPACAGMTILANGEYLMDEFPQLPMHDYPKWRHEIRSGDILLCSGNFFFSSLIQKATQSVWSHVAFILRLDMIDRIMVLESVESIGVRSVPLSSYLRDYNASGKPYPGRLMIARHQDMQPKNIVNLSRTAVDLLGYPYAKEQIIRIATRISMSPLGLNHPLANKSSQHDFICSEYAHLCFHSVGVQVEHNPLGFIAPADFARCPKVKPICYLQ